MVLVALTSWQASYELLALVAALRLHAKLTPN